MFCLKCGKEIDDQSLKCPFCGCPTENATSRINVEEVDPSIEEANIKGTIGIVLGIVGILFAWLLAIFGWICAIIGGIFSIIGRNKNKYARKPVWGCILSAIALICSCISSFIHIFLSICGFYCFRRVNIGTPDTAYALTFLRCRQMRIHPHRR